MEKWNLNEGRGGLPFFPPVNSHLIWFTIYASTDVFGGSLLTHKYFLGKRQSSTYIFPIFCASGWATDRINGHCTRYEANEHFNLCPTLWPPRHACTKTEIFLSCQALRGLSIKLDASREGVLFESILGLAFPGEWLTGLLLRILGPLSEILTAWGHAKDFLLSSV